MTSEEEDNLLDGFFYKDGTSIANRLSNAITWINKREDKGDATCFLIPICCDSHSHQG